ncbi:PD-(D/E)XK nuclease domain-containing protein [Nocardioides sp. YJ-D4]
MVTVFDREFVHVSEEVQQELRSLAEEGVIYQYMFLEDDDPTPTYVRIRLHPAEMVRYVSGAWAHEQFLGEINRGLAADVALDTVDDQRIATEVRQYNVWASAAGQGSLYCLAAFLGSELENLLCSAIPGRFDVIGRTYEHDRRHLLRDIVAALPEAVNHLSRTARQGLSGLEFSAEEQVRDLLFCMLRGVFPDAQLEDPTEKQAGRSKRIDVVLRTISTVIELKFVRESNHGSIGDELRIDIESYPRHSAAKTLLCVVWDPNRALRDRHTLVHDLSGRRTRDGREFAVEVIVVP